MTSLTLLLLVFLSSWNANAKSLLNQDDPVSHREGKQFVLPYYYPAFYTPERSYPHYGAGYRPGFPRQQTYYNGFPSEVSPKQPHYSGFPSFLLDQAPKQQYYNGFPNIPSKQSFYKSDWKNPAKEPQAENDDEEATELATSLVDDYLNQKLVGVEPANTVMKYVLRDLSATDALWRTDVEDNDFWDLLFSQAISRQRPSLTSLVQQLASNISTCTGAIAAIAPRCVIRTVSQALRITTTTTTTLATPIATSNSTTSSPSLAL